MIYQVYTDAKNEKKIWFSKCRLLQSIRALEELRTNPKADFNNQTAIEK